MAPGSLHDFRTASRIRGIASVSRSNQKVRSVILKARGDGLILLRADVVFETGRSDTLLELKPWLDAEAALMETPHKRL